MITITPISETVDDLSAARLRAAMQGHVQRGRLRHILDLRSLPMLETGTLSALIRSLRTVREAGGSVTLVADQPRIRTILAATGLDRVFAVFADLEEAIGSMERKRLLPVGGADIA